MSEKHAGENALWVAPEMTIDIATACREIERLQHAIIECEGSKMSMSDKLDHVRTEERERIVKALESDKVVTIILHTRFIAVDRAIAIVRGERDAAH